MPTVAPESHPPFQDALSYHLDQLTGSRSPPASPDLNPIESVFSRIKNELRRREFRTVAALENAFGESLDWITPTDARHYFEHAGYTA